MTPCPHCGARCIVVKDEWSNPLDRPYQVACAHCDYLGPSAASEEEAKAAHAANKPREQGDLNLGGWDST